MPTQIYLTPKETGDSSAWPRHISSLDTTTGKLWPLVGRANAIPYGLGNFYLCVATDIDTTLDAIAAESDVYGGWPRMQDDALTVSEDAIGPTARSAIGSYVESYGCPGTWISNSDTWGGVFRSLYVMCMFAQTLKGRGQTELAPQGVTLNTTWATLNSDHPAYAADVAGTFTDLGIPTDWITDGHRLRTIWKDAETQYTEAITTAGIGI